MKVLYRLGFYLGGFALGLILLAFFLKGSDTSIPSCSYMPNARVLKSIRSKGYSLSAKAKKQMKQMQVDTSAINYLLREGEVNFSQSEQRKKPCGIFLIEGVIKTKPIFMQVSSCDEKAIIDLIGYE